MTVLVTVLVTGLVTALVIVLVTVAHGIHFSVRAVPKVLAPSVITSLEASSR